jgi:hypothetical protein
MTRIIYSLKSSPPQKAEQFPTLIGSASTMGDAGGSGTQCDKPLQTAPRPRRRVLDPGLGYLSQKPISRR